MPAAAPRQYDRAFAWQYEPAAVSPGAGLISVMWDGLALNTGDQPDGLCSVIENVDGWLDSPPLSGNDAARTIADGAAWGPKTLGPRTVIVSGAAAGPRERLRWLRDQLVRRAAARFPAELSIGDLDLDRILTADVRAGTEQFRHTPLGRSGFRWQAALTAADPLLYDITWQTATLHGESDADTGRTFPKEYQWRYAAPYLPNTAVLANAGNQPAPVFALYTGDFTESRLTDAQSGMVRLAPLITGMQIRVATAALTAEAEGGLSRASYILPGSRPMTVPPGAESRWFLYAAGYGDIQLAWRSAWA